MKVLEQNKDTGTIKFEKRSTFNFEIDTSAFK